MGDQRSTARTAIIIVAGIVLVLAGWFLWPYFITVPVDEPPPQQAKEATIKTIEPATEDTSGSMADIPNEEKQAADASQRSDFRVAREGEFASVNEGQFYTTTDIVDLVPSEKATEFATNQRVYAYAGVRSLTKENVRFRWFGKDGNEILPSQYLEVEPNLGEVGYRVYTYRVFRSPGSYEVALFNSAGSEIARQSFQVK